LNAGVLNVARKVKFINTFTNREDMMLEIKLDQMATAGNHPSNGIIYSEIPIRIANAKKLPSSTGNPSEDSFNVICEENVYLKGDYNNPDNQVDWITSAVISKKRIYCLSDDFNDPQVLPALTEYLNHASLYVADPDGDGTYLEYNPETEPGGIWVYQSYLDSDGVPDGQNYYPDIPDDQQYALRQLIDQKITQYRNTFDHPDPTGTVEATFSWTRTGDNTEEKYTWGMMPPAVSKDTTYNCLMASYRLDPSDPGDTLERWDSSYRIMKGAYFRLMSADDGGDFAAAYGDFVDLEGDWSRDNRGRDPSLWHGQEHYIGCQRIRSSYDSRFVSTSSGSSKGIFFGGGPPPTWREIALSEF
jgi:hypothetical protein